MIIMGIILFLQCNELVGEGMLHSFHEVKVRRSRQGLWFNTLYFRARNRAVAITNRFSRDEQKKQSEKQSGIDPESILSGREKNQSEKQSESDPESILSGRAKKNQSEKQSGSDPESILSGRAKKTEWVFIALALRTHSDFLVPRTRVELVIPPWKGGVLTDWPTRHFFTDCKCIAGIWFLQNFTWQILKLSLIVLLLRPIYSSLNIN